MVAVVMLFSMLCPAAYADDETKSFDACSHDWVTPIRSGYSVSVPGTDYSISVKTEQCSKCKWYKHIATLIFAEFHYSLSAPLSAEQPLHHSSHMPESGNTDLHPDPDPGN